MNEIQYIDDPRGGRVPMTDAYGNLTVDAMFLYNEDLLSPKDKALMETLLAEDEMARDALEGYTMMDNVKKAKAAVASINSSLDAEKSDAPTPVIKLDYRKLSAAAAVIILIGIGAFVGTQFIGQEQLAENVDLESTEAENKNSKVAEPNKQQPSDESLKALNQDDLIEADAEIEEENRESDLDKDEGSVMIGSTEQPEQEAEPSVGNNSLDLAQNENEKETTSQPDREELLDRLASLKKKKAEVSKPVESKEIAAATAANQVAAVESQSIVLMENDLTTTEESELVAMDRIEEADELNDARQANEQVSEEEKALAQENSRSVNRFAEMREQPEPVQAEAESGVDQTVFSVNQVDQTPRFPGGDLELFKFIEKRKIHPPNLVAQGVEGEVFVSFRIDSNGNVTDVKPLRSDNSQLETDAIRVVRSMPKWQAAKKGGYPVAVKKTILIKYNLKED